jgi:fatty-acyl-CoA synthase
VIGSIWGALDGWAIATPDRPALIQDDRRLDFAALATEVRRLAALLTRREGIGRGDRVAFLGPNAITQILLVFAAARLGATVVPLNWRLTAPELGHALANAGPRLLLADPAFMAEAKGAITAAGVAVKPLADDADLARRIQATPDDAPSIGAEGDRLLIVHTSGTTGRPKGAVLTQRAVLWNALNARAAFDLTAADRVLTALPLFHVGGLNIQTLPALLTGASVHLHGRFDPARTLVTIARERITQFLAVPALMRALIDHGAWSDADLSSLRCLGTGSSIVPQALIAAFHARGVPVTQVYGCTETAPIAITLRAEDAVAHAGSCGRPAVHCRARVVDAEGRDAPDGTPGEVWVRGPNVSTGYWNDPDATAEAFTDGWFRTGDIGYRRADGFWFIVDRLKDVVISGGENIYPAEIEALLDRHPAIAELAVVGAADPRWGEVPVAIAVLRDPAFDLAALHAALDGRLARFKWPRRLVTREALPRTALGKIAKDRLRAELGDL